MSTTERLSGAPAGTVMPAPADFSLALAEGFAARVGMLARRLGAHTSSVRWAQRAAFAASRATSEGHVCVPLSALASRDGDDIAEIRAALLASGVACDGTQKAEALRPLVIDAADRLYLARYYDYERRLARLLVAHAQGSPAVSDAYVKGLQDKLERFFGPAPHGEVDWQRVAAVTALSGRLTIVSGGPGTGKTTTVAGLLACLLDTQPDLRIALAAPTGKAAQRMQEALLARAATLPAELAARLPTTSYTLHRLLGQSPGGGFRHHRDNPLPYDVVVVDEASMIDVAMATHLLDALAPRTRLVMLGDKDQLAAVEAGAVFAELSARPAFSRQGVERIATALGIGADQFEAALPDTGGRPLGAMGAGNSPHGSRHVGQANNAAHGDLFDPRPPEEEAKSATIPGPAVAATAVLTDCVVWLERNYRFGLDSPIGRLSLAIRRGDAQAALEALASGGAAGSDAVPANPAVFYEDDSAPLSERTATRLAGAFAPYAQALRRALAAPVPDPVPLFDTLNRFRVLCATRLGARGVDALNALIAARVRRAANVLVGIGANWYAGRPVMVTRNDYALGLFNGDIGIALPGADGVLRVYFRTSDGGVRTVSPAALPPHDTAFALTVHKSQGSEFDHAALVLPAGASRVLSRELVYTAITRARERVEVVGSRAVFAEAVATPTQRDSGLSARIAEALREANQEDKA
ncbi:AAA family ATPase [Paraburkholderia kururiensis]|uniref:RecBCD enzyme subunit RecD n=1 Tax=Paraburkholderia kururiensis TaxID=984307 RepID=A0ABZ0WSL6_9BURK|nr:AAA family ATPase [Paraburkholderia kururiensis]WQD80393.1 AAA family ATPase [Paraburkholderia kururiensis]